MSDTTKEWLLKEVESLNLIIACLERIGSIKAATIAITHVERLKSKLGV